MEKTYSNPRMAAVIDNWPLGHNKRGLVAPTRKPQPLAWVLDYIR
jgi:hypothetical protein